MHSMTHDLSEEKPMNTHLHWKIYHRRQIPEPPQRVY